MVEKLDNVLLCGGFCNVPTGNYLNKINNWYLKISNAIIYYSQTRENLKFIQCA